MSLIDLPAPAAVLVDIEGTVGSISYVRDVLFPFARQRLRAFVNEHHERGDVARELAAVAHESGAADLSSQIAVLEAWSDADRKATPLKALQGMIWQGGYGDGTLVAHLYPDATSALRRWHSAAVPVYVYSSGSIAAQKLYFSHTSAGDLTSLLAGYFDTTTGPKAAARSYQTIADAVGLAGRPGLFLSDAKAELLAAVAAGWHGVQVRRENTPIEAFEPFVRSFDELPF